jgi:aminopeptidase N
MMITVPKGLVVAAPGLLQKTSSKNNKTTYHWKTNYTISNYCVVFNIAKYKVARDSYTTINGNNVPIEYYVLEEDTAHAKKLIQTKIRDTKILEKYFGEYPWVKEKIGIAEVPNPGMEHQTMITFQNKFDYKNIGGQDYSDNLFHEYAHEWWANKVTNKDWAHMWIQEGIATYAEALAMYELGGQDAYNEMISQHRRNSRNTKAIVPAEVASEVEVYNGDIYFKGSFFMHGLRFLIGDDVFFPTLKKLATDPAYTYDNVVGTNDVEQLFSKASGKNLKPFFDFYLRTPDLLNINVKETGYQTYIVKASNYFMDLPIEINTGNKAEKMVLSKEGITVKSITPPIVDPRGFYLKKVSY